MNNMWYMQYIKKYAFKKLVLHAVQVLKLTEYFFFQIGNFVLLHTTLRVT